MCQLFVPCKMACNLTHNRFLTSKKLIATVQKLHHEAGFNNWMMASSIRIFLRILLPCLSELYLSYWKPYHVKIKSEWKHLVVYDSMESSNAIYIVGMNIWPKVHQQSWMILFLLIHISMFCTCHLPSLVQRDLGGLKNPQIVILHMAWTLKMDHVVTWTVFVLLSVLTICKK